MARETLIPIEHDLETVDINVNVGPQHPATHGVFRMVLTVDGEVVTDLDPVIGYMHRGNEKLPENCDYRQVIGYHDRTDYLAQFMTEHCYVAAVEKLGGIVPTERAEYIRVILAELNRFTSHLMFLGAFGTDVGLFGTSFMYAFRDREYVQDFFEEITGERMMYNYFRPGGVAWDVPDNFRERCTEIVGQIRRGLGDIDGLLIDNEVVLARDSRPLAGEPTGRDQLGPIGPDAASDRRGARPAARRALLDLRPLRVRYPGRQAG